MARPGIDKEVADAKTRKYIFIVGGVAWLYAILVFLQFRNAKANDIRLSDVEAFAKAFSGVFTNPAGNIPKGDVVGLLSSILGLSLLAGAMIWLTVTDRKLKKHDTKVYEAKFMDKHDLDEYNKKFTAPFGSKDNNDENNMIISRDIKLALDNKKTRLNCNMLIIGGSGAGKSRFFVSPNILQYNCNYVVTDPSGELLHDFGKALENNGYKVNVFNLVKPYQSSRYNPFHYIHEESDVATLINTLIQNTTPQGASKGDPFWENSEKLLLSAIILYLWHETSEDEYTIINETSKPIKLKQDFESVLTMLACAEIDEIDASQESDLDKIFASLKRKKDMHGEKSLAIDNYNRFKQGGGKTLKGILISVNVRLAPFSYADIRYLTGEDNLDFEHFSDTKQVLFVIIPTADDTNNFLVSLMYSQLFATLYKYVETQIHYGWNVTLGKGKNIRVFHAQNNNESQLAQQEANELVSCIKKDAHVYFDKEKNLYHAYTKHYFNKKDEKKLRFKEYYLATQSEGSKDPYTENDTVYLFETRNDAVDFLREHEGLGRMLIQPTIKYLKTLYDDFKVKQVSIKNNNSNTQIVSVSDTSLYKHDYYILMKKKGENLFVDKKGVHFFTSLQMAAQMQKELIENKSSGYPGGGIIRIPIEDDEIVRKLLRMDISKITIHEGGNERTIDIKDLSNNKGAYYIITAVEKQSIFKSLQTIYIFQDLIDAYEYLENSNRLNMLSVSKVEFDKNFFASCQKANVLNIRVKNKKTDRGNSVDYIPVNIDIGWRGTKEDINAFIKSLSEIQVVQCPPKSCLNHVRFMLDEFANIGAIPKFSEKLATIRKYEISCSIILQSLSQLKSMYDKQWNEITGNCDVKLFLGSDDLETIKWLLDMLGKRDTKTASESYQANKSGGSTSIGNGSVELMTVDQVSKMKMDECLVRVRSENPYYGKKYELTLHPNYSAAKAVEGTFVIPSSGVVEDESSIPERMRQDKNIADEFNYGVFRTETETKHVVEKNQETSEQTSSSAQNIQKQKTPEEEQRAIRNKANKLAAADAEKLYNDNFGPDSDKNDTERTFNIISSFGITPESSPSDIKDILESIVSVEIPPDDVITFAMTN